jgi:2-oxo-4-hydroxy-4-carboxy-5-ureidoimidazoline decarboxylase
VLDTHAGHPAAGVAIELAELPAHGAPHVIASGTTNLDGRTDQPLISGRPIPVGRYELRFHVGAYFTRRGAPQSDPPFLDVVPVRFDVAEPESHYHLPRQLTVTLRPTEPREDGAAHHPILVFLGEEIEVLGEMRDALTIRGFGE